MFRRDFLLSALVVTACASGDAGAGDRSGRLVLTRETPRRETLLDTPATARYCDRDSTLSIVAVSDEWSAAVAMRSVWPFNAAESSFVVASTLGAGGSGAVAARPLADTTQSAMIGGGGTITVTPGPSLSGHFSVEAPRDSGAAIPLAGRFENLIVRTDGCP
jgi:hypothetical protein